MSQGIDVEHPVLHVHTQNGLAEATIKRLQMVARVLVMRSNLPESAWGYTILHAALLIRFRPTRLQPFSAYQLVTGYEPDISHLRIFGCAVYVPIEPPQRRKMGPQRRLGIYVGYESTKIVRYLEPSTGDLFTARFADCHFDETIFPSLGGDRNNFVPQKRQELSWSVPTLSHLDPRTTQCDLEVRRILDLQHVSESMPDAFTDIAKVTRSYIPAANVPARLEIPVQRRGTDAVRPGQSAPDAADGGFGNPAAACGGAAGGQAPPKKRGRPQGSTDTRPRKRREKASVDTEALALPVPPIIDVENPSHEIVSDYSYVQESLLGDASTLDVYADYREISLNNAGMHEMYERNSLLLDDVFAYSVAQEILDHEDVEPRSVAECQRRADWPKWKNAIQAELESLNKRKVFGPVMTNTAKCETCWTQVGFCKKA